VPDFSLFQHGRLDHDPVRVASVEPHIISAPAPADFPTNIIWTPSLVQNNVLPTCTIAGLMNSARIWALRHGFDLVYVEAKLLEFFASIAGCSDTIAAIAATKGLVMLDVMERAAAGKFDVGEQAPLIPRVRRIEINDMDAVKDAIVSNGSACIGVTLRQADVQPNADWRGGIAKAGPKVGGHCAVLYGYIGDDFDAATWGERIVADKSWLTSRWDEAYSLEWTFSV
jgi:hypothetical protein